MRIAVVFNKLRPDATGAYLERAARALGHTVDHWWLTHAARIPPAYDLYLRVDHGDDYEAVLPARLRPSVFYAIDTHLPHSRRKIRRLASRFDLVFCAQREATTVLPQAEWLPVACEPELYGERPEQDVWDVAFVGTDGGVPRKFYLQALRERYPNSLIGPAEHTRLGSIYQSSRIGFNYSIADDVNMRIFEVLAAEALLVTNALAHDDLAALGLKDRVHYVAYRASAEIFELIDYYLAHPQERRRIAQAGCACARERHTYAHRLTQLLTRASQRLGIGRTTESQPAREPAPCAST